MKKTNREEKYKQSGSNPHDETDRLFNPIHWLQFLDDAAIVMTYERETKLLLDCLTKWRKGSAMTIRVDNSPPTTSAKTIHKQGNRTYCHIW